MQSAQLVAVADVFLSALLTGLMIAVGFMIRSYINGQKERDQKLTEISTQLQLMNQGASVGAQTLIRQLAGRVDVAESRLETDDDRINSLNTDVAIMRERFEGHVRTPQGNAHP